MAKTGKSIYTHLTWGEDKEEIMTDLLHEDDHLIITSYQSKGTLFFTELDKTRSFINEIDSLTKLHPDMPLYRAFWIINLIYQCYYRKTKFSCLNSYYVTRLKCLHSDKKRNNHLSKA